MGLDLVEMVLWAEKEFDVALMDEPLREVDTIGKFVFLILDLRTEKHPEKPLSFDEIYEAIREYIFRRFDIPWAKIDVNSHFVKDLRMG
jgi:hypothetical protein